jgi:hypothetical protein
MNAFTALGVVFVTLKLLGLLLWSWWLVLLPFYFVLALVVFTFAGAGILAVLTALAVWLAEKWGR